VGGGYDFVVSTKFAISPFISYRYCDVDNLEFNAVTFGLGFLIY